MYWSFSSHTTNSKFLGGWKYLWIGSHSVSDWKDGAGGDFAQLRDFKWPTVQRGPNSIVRPQLTLKEAFLISFDSAANCIFNARESNMCCEHVFLYFFGFQTSSARESNLCCKLGPFREKLRNWGKPTIQGTLLTNRNCATSSMKYNSYFYFYWIECCHFRKSLLDSQLRLAQGKAIRRRETNWRMLCQNIASHNCEEHRKLAKNIEILLSVVWSVRFMNDN